MSAYSRNRSARQQRAAGRRVSGPGKPRSAQHRSLLLETLEDRSLLNGSWREREFTAAVQASVRRTLRARRSAQPPEGGGGDFGRRGPGAANWCIWTGTAPATSDSTGRSSSRGSTVPPLATPPQPGGAAGGDRGVAAGFAAGHVTPTRGSCSPRPRPRRPSSTRPSTSAATGRRSRRSAPTGGCPSTSMPATRITATRPSCSVRRYPSRPRRPRTTGGSCPPTWPTKPPICWAFRHAYEHSTADDPLAEVAFKPYVHIETRHGRAERSAGRRQAGVERAAVRRQSAGRRRRSASIRRTTTPARSAPTGSPN